MGKGIVKNRESFLNKIAENLGRERKKEGIVRPEWEHQPQWNVLKNHSDDQLLDVLEKQCESIHTHVYRTTQNHLSEKIREVIKDSHGKSVITWNDERFSSFGLREPFKKMKDSDDIMVHEWDSEKGYENVRIAEQADVGITFSDQTIAESGTVVLLSNSGNARSVSLLPSTYIAIIPKSTVVPRLSQATREMHQRVESGERVASCVNFISGPSNSADIEMNLVVGVHGPIKATYIIVEDR